MRPHRICLATVAAAVLLASVDGCCRNVPDEENVTDHEGIVAADLFDRIRSENTTDEERCEAACFELAALDDISLDEVRSCTAQGDSNPDEPWAEMDTRATITCTGMFLAPGFCTGRRPQGHQESTQDVVSVGTWFSVHAHLERASVRAFVELADWLQARGAPPALVERCRRAAADEVVHAAMMERLATEGGASVEPCRAEPPSEVLVDVALHNAVEGCVYESFAAMVAMVQSREAVEPAHRAAFERIAEDELRHGQLAWDLHVWLMEQLDDDAQALVRSAQADALARLPARAATNAAVTPKRLGWPSIGLAQQMASRFVERVSASGA